MWTEIAGFKKMSHKIRILFRSALIIVMTSAITAQPCVADWSSEHFSKIENSLYCTDMPPAGIPPEHYKWPKDNGDAYHDKPEIYYKKKMFFCHGKTPDTEKITYVWPSWKFGLHEDQLYPVAFVKTSLGLLAQRGRETLDSTLWLNGEPFLKHLLEAKIYQSYPEKNGEINIVVAELSDLRDDRFKGYSSNSNGYYVIDFGTTPPFISEKSLPPVRENPEEDDDIHPAYGGYKVKKIDENTYEFSGDWWTPDDVNPADHPAAKYVYDRKSGTITPWN